jgi:HlyD family secretion protein
MSEAEPDARSDLEEFLGENPETRRTRWRIWALAALAVVVVLVLIGYFLASGSQGPRYATAQVVRGDMTVFVNATGNLKPTNEVSVGSELSGLIDRVYVDVNDRVSRGQPLAQIDTDKFNDQVRRSRASREQARASVLQAQASVELSRANLARQEEVLRLSGGKVPSKADIDSARAQYQRDLATLASARASVVSAEAQLATDLTNLGKATIRSPVNGVILSRQVEPGQTVAASFSAPTLFVIAEDLTEMELEVKVDEADVGQVSKGQPATFTVDAYPGKTFEARIVRVNVGSNTSTSAASTGAAAGGSSSVVSYGAVLSVANPELALRPGMTATASILASKEENVLTVPNSALRYNPPTTGGARPQGGFGMFGGGNRGVNEQEVAMVPGSLHNVYALGADRKPRKVQVRIGESNGARTIVRGGGLKAGDVVVTGELATEE